MAGRSPWRVRFRVPLTLIPPLVGIAVAVPLWGHKAEIEFFQAATEVLAIGAVGMALSGRFFRLSIHRDASAAGAYAIVNVVSVLLGIGVGLGFSFGALAVGHSREPDLAIVAGGLCCGVAAFALQALFGTPGLEDEEPTDTPIS